MLIGLDHLIKQLQFIRDCSKTEDDIHHMCSLAVGVIDDDDKYHKGISPSNLCIEKQKGRWYVNNLEVKQYV